MLLEQTVPNADTLPALTLAYIGDAVFELYVRTHLLEKSRNAHTLNKLGVARVNHHAQARLYNAIKDDLNDTESGVLNRGRNAKGILPRNADAKEYRKATAIEALAGYLYLNGQTERLLWMLAQIEDVLKEAGHESSGPDI